MNTTADALRKAAATRKQFCQRLEGHKGEHSAARRDLGAAYMVSRGAGAPDICGEIVSPKAADR